MSPLCRYVRVFGRLWAEEASMQLIDRLWFSRRGKLLIAVVVVTALIGTGVLIGVRMGGQGRSTDTPPVASSSEGETSSPPSAVPGNSTAITSNSGVDYGASLPRLDGSPFARTDDPEVFAASVRAGLGYDYTQTQPTDLAAEADRINSEIIEGMTPTDGPLGPSIHDAYRQAVVGATDLDQLGYRIEAHQKDEIDIISVSQLSNESLHHDVGNDVYSAIIGARAQGIYQYSVEAAVTTTMQPVDDTAGWTRTVTNSIHLLVHCPDGGVCTLIGIIGAS